MLGGKAVDAGMWEQEEWCRSRPTVDGEVEKCVECGIDGEVRDVGPTIERQVAVEVGEGEAAAEERMHVEEALSESDDGACEEEEEQASTSTEMPLT